MKRNIYVFDLLFWLMAAACLVLMIGLGLVRPPVLFLCVVFILFLGLIFSLNVSSLRRRLAAFLFRPEKGEKGIQSSLGKVNLPALVIQGERVLWYNEAFLADVLEGEAAPLMPLEHILPPLSREKMAQPEGQDITWHGRQYTVYGNTSTPHGKKDPYLAYFVNNTALKEKAFEYAESRPAVLSIAVDTYDDILREMKESERARLASDIDAALEHFVGTTSGFLRRVSSSRYLAVVEERHMREMIESRFSVLDAVRALGGEQAAATLSIGVGRMGATLREGEDMAAQALDMALGRGGDQAAVRSPEGFEFYGGVSRGVEKRSKVRSRIIANALSDLIRQSEQVFIMGHKMSDLDCVGAAVGVWRICQMCETAAAIVVDKTQSLAANLIDSMEKSGCEFLSPAGVENAVHAHTLVVIVDTHLRAMLENPAIYDRAEHVVVIDHHRRCVGYIENGVILYHEPSASSASELVAELVQYTEGDKANKITPSEAQALLAGIMLDTRDFSIHTGVRTFEAAAFLRRMGAQTAQVKKLFQSTAESYAYRAQLVTAAELFEGCAVAVADHIPPDQQVAVPQAANDLLTIENVQASFVAVDTGEQIVISARSMGEVNVQVILEKLGGGGHLTMAGAQLKNATLEEAKRLLLEAIADYRRDSAKK